VVSRITKLSAANLSRVTGTQKHYALDARAGWECGSKGSGFWITVKAGKPFDVSMPKALYRLGKIWGFRRLRKMCHDPKILFAAAIHDQSLEDGHDGDFSSAEFRRVLRAMGVGKKLAGAMFYLTMFHTGQDRSKYRKAMP